MRGTLKLCRAAAIPAALSAGWLFSACGGPTISQVPAEFDHWVGDDGTTRWRLTLPPETWLKLGRGEPLDATHQNISRRSMQTVSELIDASLARTHLCPGEWTMGDLRRSEDGYLTFQGACDVAVGTRT
jgi:hypothetical protein